MLEIPTLVIADLIHCMQYFFNIYELYRHKMDEQNVFQQYDFITYQDVLSIHFVK